MLLNTKVWLVGSVLCVRAGGQVVGFGEAGCVFVCVAVLVIWVLVLVGLLLFLDLIELVNGQRYKRHTGLGYEAKHFEISVEKSFAAKTCFLSKPLLERLYYRSVHSQKILPSFTA